MTEEAKRAVEILRSVHFNNYDCRYCPIYVICPSGTIEDDNICMLDKAADLIESLSAKLEEAENNLSELLYYVTGGRYSKADYSTDDMRRFVDDYNQSVCNECDELERVTKERDAAVVDLRIFGESCRACAHRGNDAVCQECRFGLMEGHRLTRTNWQWRGVKEE